MTINSDLVIEGTNRPLKDVQFKGSEEYTTTKQKVGIWHDGRPIYRVVYIGTTPSTNGTWKTVYTGNVDKVISYGGYWYLSSDLYFAIPWGTTFDDIWVCTRSNTGAINIAIDTTSSSQNWNKPLEMWFDFIEKA